jgi:hypothetical protein
MSHDGKEPRRDAQPAPLDVIRVETALSRFPVHRLAKSGTVRIELRETNDNGEMTVQWEVSHNSKFDQPGPLAYKIDALVVNRKLEEAGRPVPRIIRLGGLKEIARELGLSTHDTRIIKHALYQNASAFITAKIRYKSVDGTERRIEIGDTRYAIVMTGETLPDGRTADAVYIVLHDFYREILDNALTRPLDFDYLRELPPAPQRLYELLSYPMFGALKHGRSKARLVYSAFCTCAPQTRYFDWEHTRKQMAKVHAPHRKSGYIADVEFEATTDHAGRPDWTMVYTPGPKARVEYRVFTKKGGLVALEVEPVTPEPEPKPAGLEQELVSRGVTRGVATELVRDYPATRIKAQIEQMDGTRRKIQDKAAYLVSAIREDFTTKAIAPPTKAEPQAAKAEAPDEQALQARAQDLALGLRMRTFWERLAPAEREAFDAEALAHAAPELRAAYDRQDDPRLRRLHLTPIRDAHLRARLASG